MEPRGSSGRRAFTLVELLAVVIILAILAGIALPRFFNHRAQALEAACKGSLAGVRSGMASFYLDKAISGSPAYPDYGEISQAGAAMQEELPDNPYNGMNTVRLLGLGDANIRFNDDTTGWCYYKNNTTNPPQAVFWANSNNAGENTF